MSSTQKTFSPAITQATIKLGLGIDDSSLISMISCLGLSSICSKDQQMICFFFPKILTVLKYIQRTIQLHYFWGCGSETQYIYTVMQPLLPSNPRAAQHYKLKLCSLNMNLHARSSLIFVFENLATLGTSYAREHIICLWGTSFVSIFHLPYVSRFISGFVCIKIFLLPQDPIVYLCHICLCVHLWVDF